MRGKIGAVAKPRGHLKIAHLQHVARPSTLDADRPGHEVDTRIAVLRRNRIENVSDPGIHHQFGGIAGMMRQRLHTHDVAVRDCEHGGKGCVEIAPVYGCRGRPQFVQHRAQAGAFDLVLVFHQGHVAIPPLACLPKV
jgi:hypothetical protein